MAEFNSLSAPITNSLSSTPAPEQQAPELLLPKYNVPYLLELGDRLKRESFDFRYVWEREWLRDIYYIANRQWIAYHPSKRDWIDKRFDKDIPRPVTNKMAEVVQAIRANLSAINLDVMVRPTGSDPESISTAEVADQLSPVIFEEHEMKQVMREADFWLLATGNACLQVSWDRDKRFNRVFIPSEQCLTCGAIVKPQELDATGGFCPTCMGSQFTKATNPDGSPAGEFIAHGRGKTTALSPFEYALPPNIVRFNETPYIIRLRWRDKHYWEANHPDLVHRLSFDKGPSDRSMQIFKSLALSNDVGTGTQFSTLGSTGTNTVEGLTEFEYWIRPNNEFPEGFVMRLAGEKNPVLIESPDEGIPGPLPYKDIEGNPLFPFFHAQYEHIGGRLYGRSAVSPLIQKQDQINQLDSLILMSVQSVANPVWIIPEGAGIEHFTGKPGLIVKWQPLAAGGQGKPERLGGENIPGTLFQLREQYLRDIEELAGTYDIIKGQKPTGVEAFSAIQALIERSQARFGSAYSSRGEMVRQWFGVALELERQFGPDTRTQAISGAYRGYSFRHFENAQLQRSVRILIEDGNQAQKTALGKRAAIEQANQLGLIDPSDPEQRYTILSQFGLSDLVPSLDHHVQAALQMQDEFERWAEAPQGPPPLQLKPWHNPQIHWSERVKWMNTDRMRELIKMNPMIEQIISQHLFELQMVLAPPMPEEEGQEAEGSGMAMENSNRESGEAPPLPAGKGESAQSPGAA